MSSHLEALQGPSGLGGLTCDLSDMSNEVAVLLAAFAWRNNTIPFSALLILSLHHRGIWKSFTKVFEQQPPKGVLVVAMDNVERAVWG